MVACKTSAAPLCLSRVCGQIVCLKFSASIPASPGRCYVHLSLAERLTPSCNPCAVRSWIIWPNSLSQYVAFTSCLHQLLTPHLFPIAVCPQIAFLKLSASIVGSAGHCYLYCSLARPLTPFCALFCCARRSFCPIPCLDPLRSLLASKTPDFLLYLIWCARIYFFRLSLGIPRSLLRLLLACYISMMPIAFLHADHFFNPVSQSVLFTVRLLNQFRRNPQSHS